jgi:exosortase
VSLVFAVLVVLLIVVVYGLHGNTQEVEHHGRSAILWMTARWGGVGGDLSHCWLIPIISVYLVWRRRRDLASAARRVNGTGLVVIVLSLCLHWVGMRAQLTRLSLLSLIGVLWGIPLYLYGWGVARVLLFPCAYLVFCIPLSFLNNITVPLRVFVSAVSTGLLNGVGIATIRTGTIIYSSAGQGFHFDVADPCSGLRSLLAMTALTAVYAYLTQNRLWKQWVLFLGAVPLAIAGNIARILGIALIAQWFGEEIGLGVYHHGSALIVFSVAIVLMMILGRVLNRVK